AGQGGEAETVVAAGEPFAIVLPPGSPLAPIVRFGAELATEEAAGGRLAVFGESGACRPREDEVGCGRSALPFAEGPSAPSLPDRLVLRSPDPQASGVRPVAL